MNEWVDFLVAICNILLVIGAFSAFAVYILQKNAEKKMAATLILCQVDAIDKQISLLQTEPSLNYVTIFGIKPFIRDNMWEKYKHLFVQKLSISEYELIQKYFEQIEQLERKRIDILNTVYSAWKDKSSVEHQKIGEFIFNGEMDDPEKIKRFEHYRAQFRGSETVFIPDIANETFFVTMKSFNLLAGTTAYEKLLKNAYSK